MSQTDLGRGAVIREPELVQGELCLRAESVPVPIGARGEPGVRSPEHPKAPTHRNFCLSPSAVSFASLEKSRSTGAAAPIPGIENAPARFVFRSELRPAGRGATRIGSSAESWVWRKAARGPASRGAPSSGSAGSTRASRRERRLRRNDGSLTEDACLNAAGGISRRSPNDQEDCTHSTRLHSSSISRAMLRPGSPSPRTRASTPSRGLRLSQKSIMATRTWNASRLSACHAA